MHNIITKAPFFITKAPFFFSVSLVYTVISLILQQNIRSPSSRNVITEDSRFILVKKKFHYPEPNSCCQKESHFRLIEAFQPSRLGTRVSLSRIKRKAFQTINTYSRIEKNKEDFNTQSCWSCVKAFCKDQNNSIVF